MDIKIYAKSTLNPEDLLDKQTRGNDGIEIQLFGELFADSMERYKRFENVFDKSLLLNSNIKVIHAPLLDKTYSSMFPGLPVGDITIEDMLIEPIRNLFLEICSLANYIGDNVNDTINIVFHTKYCLEDFKRNQLFESLVNLLGFSLSTFPNIEISIENLSPICGSVKEEMFINSNHLFDNVVLCRELRRLLNTERIGTVLDICHAKMTQTILGSIYTRCFSTDEYPTFRNYFKNNKDVIKLIHLNTCINNGYGKYHGLPYDINNPAQKKELEEIISLYKEFDYTCPITLEVRESSYTDSVNYTMTKEAVQICINSLDFVNSMYSFEK